MSRRRELLALAVVLGVAGGFSAWRRRPEIRPPDEPDLSGSPPPLVPHPPRLRSVGGNAQALGPAWEPATLAALARWVPPVPGRPPVRALAYAWALPMTLVGLVVGAATGVAPRAVKGVLLFANAKGLPALALRSQGYAAITFGHVVVATRDPSPSLLAHELVHTRQAERLGPLFGPAYVLLHLLYGYGRHPFERAARLGGRLATGEDAS